MQVREYDPEAEEALAWGTGFCGHDGKTEPNRREWPGCPHDCPTCKDHKTRPCCVLLEVTQRCNLRCPVCYAASGTQSRPDPSLHELEKRLDWLLEQAGPVHLQLSGGEPTVREDLAEIITLAKRKGFPYIQLNTNGLMLGYRHDYARKLKRAGLNCVFLQFDSLKKQVYETLRGRDILFDKYQAILNCEEAGLPVVLVPTVVKSINDGELGQIVKFAMKNSPTVRGVHLQPITFAGRIPETPVFERMGIPAVLRELERQTEGMVRVVDFSAGTAEHPLCSFSANYVIGSDGTLMSTKVANQLIAYPKRNRKSAVNGEDAVAHAQGTVVRRWGTDLEKLEKPEPDDKTPEAFMQRIKRTSFSITGMAFQDAWTIDFERLERCYIFVLGDEGHFAPFCAYNLTSTSGASLYRNIPVAETENANDEGSRP